MKYLPLLALFACSPEPTPPPVAAPVVVAPPPAPAVPEQVQKAVKIANAIEKDPSRIEAILTENGVTREQFEGMLYDIAADPALASSYAAARAG